MISCHWRNPITLDCRLEGFPDDRSLVLLGLLREKVLASSLLMNLNEAVVAWNTLTLRVKGLHDYQAFQSEVLHLFYELDSSAQPQQEALPDFIIPTCYDPRVAEDLEGIAAERFGSNIERLIEAHSGQAYRVYAVGFMPGFAYLGFTPPSLHLPRVPTPRKKVPSLSVAIAENQTAVYPQASPGGWNLIGRARVDLLDQQGETKMQVGQLVRFKPISYEDWCQP